MDNIHKIEKVISGINKAADAVKTSYGPKGYATFIERPIPPYHEISRDGITILESIRLKDPVENIGAILLREGSKEHNRVGGDGSTTNPILTQAIVNEARKSKEHPFKIKESLDDCLKIINEEIDKETKKIKPMEVDKVSLTSFKDNHIAKLFKEIYSKIGKDGIIELDNSGTPETYYDLVEGVRLRNCGFMYPYMANDPKGKTATYLNPSILIIKDKIPTVPIMDIITKKCFEKRISELVIFCDEIDPSVSSYLANGHQSGAFKTLVIKSPNLWKDWLYEDFAKITGATIIDSRSGVPLKNFATNMLGTCDKIVTSVSETIVIGIKDISLHLEKLKEDNTDEAKLRSSWLQTKAAILKIGANSETELTQVRTKVEDARNSCYLALQGGVVAGGGLCLLNVSKRLPETIGGLILKEALKAPLRQLAENAGEKVDIIEMCGGEDGYNAWTNSICNMWEEGILDAATVTKSAIKIAISVASTALTSKNIISIYEDTK